MLDVASSRDRQATLPSWLRIVLYATIALGLIFRFTNIDTKVYSLDESLTSLRTSGFLQSEYKSAVDGRVVSNSALQQFQHANAQRDPASTVHTLAVDDPQHAPLYYILDRFWDSLWGGSIAVRRTLGAIFGALSIPALFWLCRELVPRDKRMALIATALIAISPFQVQYAQQAREYTLWGLTTIVSSALLLGALRTSDRRIWIAYAASIVVGLYAYLFFFFVLVAHIACVFLLSRRARSTGLRPFAISIGVALFAYAPWIVNLIANRQTVANTNGWFSQSVPLVVYGYKWLFNVGTVFFDGEYSNALLSVLLLPIAAFVGYSIYRTARSKERLFSDYVLALLATSTLPLLLPDLLLHQSRATAARYLLPAWIAVDLAAAYVLSMWLSSSRRSARAAGATIAIIVVLGCWSFAIASKSVAWWPASTEAPVLSMVRVINAGGSALVVTNDVELALEMSNYLRPDARFYFTAAPPLDTLRSAVPKTKVYLIEPSLSLRTEIAHHRPLDVALVYAPAFTDSPFLHSSSFLSSLRGKLASIHAKAGFTGDAFSLWAVTEKSGH